MSRASKIFQGLMASVLILGLLGPAAAPVGERGGVVQPLLAEMAAVASGETVRVIVQKADTTSRAETLVSKLGGTILKDLHIINAFVAEMPTTAVDRLTDSRTVRWVSLDAPVRSTTDSGASAFTEYVLDDFEPIGFSGNDGSIAWSAAWQELGETDGPTSGRVQVSDDPNIPDGFCYAKPCLYIGSGTIEGRGLSREVDLSNASSATLSMVYRRRQLTEGTASVALQISGDAGMNWDTLETFTLNLTDSGLLMRKFDISPYTSANTQIRFVGSGDATDRRLYIDNVRVEFTQQAQSVAGVNTFLDTLGVPDVWTMGFDGERVGVAVIDSGITKEEDFGRRIKRQSSFNPNSNTVNDVNGHGTHVAGIIGGDGSASNGLYMGIAPGVQLIGLKISDENGLAYESDTVDALQWALDNQKKLNIRVVNLSIQSTVEQSYHTSPLDAAAEILWFNGIVVVAASGNKGQGQGYNTANAAPANDPFIITVGASLEHGTVSRADDTVAGFSAFGTTTDGFTKPDIIAPGKDIISVLASSSDWSQSHPDRVVNGEYFRISGTSMAAPMVTGAVALLLQAEPDLTPDQVKYRLIQTGSTIQGSSSDPNSYPYLDVDAALNMPTTESANTGITASQLLWTGDEPVTWTSVNWNSVNWNSVNWNSVNWNSVNWNSVNWNSVSFDD